jgi:MATE family multidrug resistance protein
MPRPFSPPFIAEVRANLHLALPLIGAQIATIGMGTIDSIFAGRLGSGPLAAIAVGSNLNMVFLVFSLGVLMACSPIVAHSVGGQRPPGEIACFMRRAQRVALAVGVLWAIGLNLVAAPALTHLNLAPETARVAVEFERWLSLSGIGTSLWFVQRFCAEGVGQTRPILWSGFLGLAVNALLDWLLLFGHWGFPAVGVVGCGIATSVSSFVMAGSLAWMFRRVPRLRPFCLADAAARTAEGARDILRLGVPIGLIMLAEAGLFVASALLMAHFGDAVVAAYQVAINFASLLFMIPLGVAMATTVRVGHAAGAGDYAAARHRGQIGMQLGLLNAASNATIMATLPLTIVGLYTKDAEIAARAAGFLLLAALFQFFDGLQVTANGALRGIKDTRMPMVITLIAYWGIGMPVACWLSLRTAVGPDGLWWGMVAGLGTAAAGLSLRFLTRSREQQQRGSEVSAY